MVRASKKPYQGVGGAGCLVVVPVVLVVLAVEIAAAVTNADRVLMAAVGPRRTEFTPPQPKGQIRIGFAH